jgi:cbb3-type cytochrome oxidase maturation protein
MGMLFVFTSLGMLLFIGAVAALIWSIRSGQLDDLDTPAMRVLVDDAAPSPPKPTLPSPLPLPLPLQPPVLPPIQTNFPAQQPDVSANAQPPRTP